MAESPKNALPVGHVVDKYRIEGVLGAGGFGIVYRGRHQDLGEVAIKEYLPPDMAVREGAEVQPLSGESSGNFNEGLRRFLEEARRLVQFNHPNVVRCRDFFRANGTAYLVMDFEDGLPLSELLQRREDQGNPLNGDEIKQVILPLLDGLATVHKHDVLHRDIKPSNILIRRSTEEPVLIDFGAAKHGFSGHSKSVWAYTQGYAPMEQIEQGGELGPWTDIYAVGAVMWRIVAGDNPPRAEDRMSAKVRGKPDPMKSAEELGKGRYPAALLKAIDKCLSLQEKGRYQLVSGLYQMLSGMQHSARLQENSTQATAERKFKAQGDNLILKRWKTAIDACHMTLRELIRICLTRGDAFPVIVALLLFAISAVTIFVYIDGDRSIQPEYQSPFIGDRDSPVELPREQSVPNDDIPYLLARAEEAPIDRGKWLFVIGIGEYKGVDDILYSRRSAELFSEVAAKTLGIGENRQRILLDGDATSIAIEYALTEMLRLVEEGGTVYFYYSGHGLTAPTQDDEFYILPTDVSPEYVGEREAHRVRFIYRQLSESKAGQVFVFMETSFILKHFEAEADGKLAILTACTDEQYSWAFEERRHRLFSYYLMRGMLDGIRKAGPLADKVSADVYKESRGRGRNRQQTPQFEGNRNMSM